MLGFTGAGGEKINTSRLKAARSPPYGAGWTSTGYLYLNLYSTVPTDNPGVIDNITRGGAELPRSEPLLWTRASASTQQRSENKRPTEPAGLPGYEVPLLARRKGSTAVGSSEYNPVLRQSKISNTARES